MDIISTIVSQDSATQMQTSGTSGTASILADAMVTIKLHDGTDLQYMDNIIVFTLMTMTGHVIVKINLVFAKIYRWYFHLSNIKNRHLNHQITIQISKIIRLFPDM
jgi:hypothetical protein